MQNKRGLAVVAAPELYRQRFGTMHTAEFISSRMNYLQLAAADGPMMLMVVMAERAVIAVENWMRVLEGRKDIYRFKVKQCCKQMKAEIGRWHAKMLQNLKDEVFDYEERFAYTLDFVDDALREDMKNLHYSVLNEMNRRGVKNADLLTGCVCSLLLVDCYRTICNIVQENAHGSLYALCIDPLNEEKRKNAIEIRPELLNVMRKLLRDIYDTIDDSEDFSITECKAVNDWFRIIIDKMTSAEIMIPAAEQNGFNISEGAVREVRKDVTPEEASRLALFTHDDTSYDDEKKLRRTLKQKSVAEGFAEKGWKVG